VNAPSFFLPWQRPLETDEPEPPVNEEDEVCGECHEPECLCENGES
jgi:hypothetical protein